MLRREAQKKSRRATDEAKLLIQFVTHYISSPFPLCAFSSRLLRTLLHPIASTRRKKKGKEKMVNNFLPASISGEAKFAFSLRCFGSARAGKAWVVEAAFRGAISSGEAKSGVNHDCNKLQLRMRFQLPLCA
jgi:hypothetical protein